MTSSDWILSYEAERIFGQNLKRKNRKDFAVFGELIRENVQFYDATALPKIFQDSEDWDDIDNAFEDGISHYDDQEDDSETVEDF